MGEPSAEERFAAFDFDGDAAFQEHMRNVEITDATPRVVNKIRRKWFARNVDSSLCLEPAPLGEERQTAHLQTSHTTKAASVVGKAEPISAESFPPTNEDKTAPPPAIDGALPIPEGYEWDANSFTYLNKTTGYHWTRETNVYYHPGSGMSYDANTGQWEQLTTGRKFEYGEDGKLKPVEQPELMPQVQQLAQMYPLADPVQMAQMMEYHQQQHMVQYQVQTQAYDAAAAQPFHSFSMDMTRVYRDVHDKEGYYQEGAIICMKGGGKYYQGCGGYWVDVTEMVNAAQQHASLVSAGLQAHQQAEEERRKVEKAEAQAHAMAVQAMLEGMPMPDMQGLTASFLRENAEKEALEASSAASAKVAATNYPPKAEEVATVANGVDTKGDKSEGTKRPAEQDLESAAKKQKEVPGTWRCQKCENFYFGKKGSGLCTDCLNLNVPDAEEDINGFAAACESFQAEGLAYNDVN